MSGSIGEQHPSADGGDPVATRADLDAAVADLRAWIDDLVGEARQCREDRAHFAGFEADLVAHLGGEEGHLGSMLAHVAARPFMSDPAALDLTGADGRPRLGYLDAEARPGDGAYAAFEAIFRGTRASILERQRTYAALVGRAVGAGSPVVVDLGCGRGEFLEALRERGIDGTGVDLDPGMVEAARSAGVDARVGDLFHELAARADGSVQVVFAAQVIEHLSPRDMPRLLAEIHRVLAPEGLAILETVNPHSLRALRFFWLDTTHTIPVYPESALMLARGAGFPAAVIHFPGAVGEGSLADALREDGDFALVVAKSAQTLRTAGLLAGG